MKRYLFLILLIAGYCSCLAQQNIGGIGAQLIMDTADGHTMPRIMTLVPNSPAYQYLNATDYIIKVNGVSCKDKDLNDIVALIRGEAGTTVVVTVADTREGKRQKDVTLTRVNMSMPGGAGADPVAAFNDRCDAKVKEMKQKRMEIVKTYTSDAGNYFFNFNADTGTYRIRVYFLEEAWQPAGSKPPFEITVKAWMNDKEAQAILLRATTFAKQETGMTAEYDGELHYTRDGVGTISTVTDDAQKKLKAMYIVVYK